MKGDVDAAKQQLAAAQSACPDSQRYDLDRIQRLIEGHERRIRERAETQAKLESKKAKHPLSDFLSWVGKLRDSSDKQLAGEVCAPRGSPAYGFCDAKVTRGDRVDELRYWKDDAAAFRFATSSKTPLDCGDLGAHRVVRDWTEKGTKRTHCELMDYPAKGLGALVSNSPTGHRVEVFSVKYLTQDAEFANLLKR